jgi:hypothetical protein
MNNSNEIEDLYNRCNQLFYIDDSFELRRKITVAPNALKDNIAGNIDGAYRRVKIDKKSYLVHRIIFLMLKGKLPDVVDHINGDTLDNHIDNLRAATKRQNRWNCLGNSGTQTGIKGVYLDRGRYKALINVEGIRYYLGMYGTLNEAEKVVNEWYIKLQQEYSMQNCRNNVKEG